MSPSHSSGFACKERQDTDKLWGFRGWLAKWPCRLSNSKKVKNTGGGPFACLANNIFASDLSSLPPQVGVGLEALETYNMILDAGTSPSLGFSELKGRREGGRNKAVFPAVLWSIFYRSILFQHEAEFWSIHTLHWFELGLRGFGGRGVIYSQIEWAEMKIVFYPTAVLHRNM